MVVLSKGNWCLYKDRVAKVMSNRPKNGRYLIQYELNGKEYLSWISRPWLTPVPEGLTPILSDSIRKGETND